MKSNHETIKVAIYNHIVNKGSNFDFSLFGAPFIAMGKKKEEAKKVINSLLDNLDIRSTAAIVKNNNVEVPKWFSNGEYVIDYDSGGILDYIIIKKNKCFC